MATRATPAIKKPEPAPKPPAPAPRSAAPAPVAATAPRAAAGPPAVRLGAPAAKGGATEGAVAPGVVELKGMSDFKPAAPVTEFLDANKTSTINARFGDLAQGPLEVKTAGKGKYRVKKQPLPLSHPAFAFVPQFVPGLTPALIVGVENNKLTGEVGLASGAKVQRISSFIQKTPDMLGLAGFTIGALPTIVNAIEGGSLHFGLKAVPIKLGSAFSGKFNFDVIDTNVSFDANAAIVVQGLANGTLDLKRAPSGLITGRAAIGLSLAKSKSFSGSVDVAWDGVAITGIGKVGYKGEKFSGEVTLQMMERNQALQLAQSKQSPPAGAAKAAAAKKPMKIDYVVFGEGDLNFSFTEWLNGTAHVIVDPKGNLTVIGKITPQKEFILFPQKDYIRPLFKFEARASYGIPVVGNIFIFANVGMDLFAKLGPAKFYNIVVDGTYSTDPTVAKNFTIQGSLNISAAAGARLRAEAGAGLEILSHDIKAGAGINGIAGIKAYAEATPVIGYREKAGEGQDMKGEWFVRGDLELAAQPFLGLSGDLFVEISTPWWSPLSDHRWTWPLFSKEWPLGSSMGMLVSVDYVFGSGQWPKFDLKPVEFDSNKFVTGLYEDSAKSGPGKELEQKGKWQEKNSAAAQPPPKGTQTGSAKPGKLDSGKAKTKQAKAKKLDKAVDPNAKTKEGKSVKQLQAEAQKKGKGGKAKTAERTEDQKKTDLDSGLAEALAVMKTGKPTPKAVKKKLAAIRTKYGMNYLNLVTDSRRPGQEVDHVEGQVNPKGSTDSVTLSAEEQAAADELELLDNGRLSPEERKSLLDKARGILQTEKIIATLLSRVKDGSIRKDLAVTFLQRVVSENLTFGYRLNTRMATRDVGFKAKTFEMDYFGVFPTGKNMIISKVRREGVQGRVPFGWSYIKPAPSGPGGGTPVNALAMDFFVPPELADIGISGVGKKMFELSAANFATKFEAVKGEWYRLSFYQSGRRVHPMSINLVSYLNGRRGNLSPEESVKLTWTYGQVKKLFGGAELEITVAENIKDLNNVQEFEGVEVTLKPQ